MKRICHYAIATHLGGGERSLLELARSQRERPELGYEPWVVLPKSEGPLIEELKKADVPFDVVPLPESLLSMSRGEPLHAARSALLGAPGMAMYLPRLLSLLARRKPALLHTNAIKCHVLGTVAAEIIRKPVIWHVRDILAPGPSLTVLQALRKFSAVHVIANSEATAEEFARGNRERIHVVHNGLRSADYADPRAGARNREFNRALGLADAVPVIGILGVLARWKGQAEFLRMASALAGAGIEAGFVIVGDSIYDTAGDRQYKDELQKLVDDLGLRSRVHFTGFRRDVPQVLRGIDVLVHASIRPEPFGRVVVEAMASRVPVVATAAGGIPEIIQSGESGLLVPPGDVPAMADAIRRILGDAAFSRKLVENGRRVFLERFTNEKYVAGVAKVYDRVLSR